MQRLLIFCFLFTSCTSIKFRDYSPRSASKVEQLQIKMSPQEVEQLLGPAVNSYADDDGGGFTKHRLQSPKGIVFAAVSYDKNSKVEDVFDCNADDDYEKLLNYKIAKEEQSKKQKAELQNLMKLPFWKAHINEPPQQRFNSVFRECMKEGTPAQVVFDHLGEPDLFSVESGSGKMTYDFGYQGKPTYLTIKNNKVVGAGTDRERLAELQNQENYKQNLQQNAQLAREKMGQDQMNINNSNLQKSLQGLSNAFAKPKKNTTTCRTNGSYDTLTTTCEEN